MSTILLLLDDKKDDAYQVEVVSSADAGNLDGGHLILMTSDRAIAADQDLTLSLIEEQPATKTTTRKGSKK